MTDTYSVKNVTADLGFLLSLTKVFTVDDEGFWFDEAGKKRFVHRHDSNDTGREIALFQDPMPKGDVLFFNPFADGFGRKSPATNLYYQTIRIAGNLDLRTAMTYVVTKVLETKTNAESGDDYSVSHIVTRMSSVPVDRKTSVYDICDDRLAGEFEKLFDRMDNEVFFITYLPQQTKATIKIDALTDPTWDEKYSKDIRKKSLLAFKAVLMGVLGISKPEELNQFAVKYDPELKTSAKFYTIMSAYQRLYTRFNDILPDAYGTDGVPSEQAAIDLGELAAVIERFPLAYKVAKHMVQPIPSRGATDTGTTDTTGLKLGGGSGFSASPGRRFPGPEIVDSFGRRGLPTGPLNLGGGNNAPMQTQSRFKPHVIDTGPVDPFAPAVRSANSDSFGGGLNLGNNQYGGQFGNQSQFGNSQFNQPSFSGGLNLNAPSTFGSPGTRKFF